MQSNFVYFYKRCTIINMCAKIKSAKRIGTEGVLFCATFKLFKIIEFSVYYTLLSLFFFSRLLSYSICIYNKNQTPFLAIKMQKFIDWSGFSKWPVKDKANSATQVTQQKHMHMCVRAHACMYVLNFTWRWPLTRGERVSDRCGFIIKPKPKLRTLGF